MKTTIETNPITWQLGVSGGALMSFSKYRGDSEAGDLRNANTSPYFGYHYGIDIEATLPTHFTLMLGLNRTVVYQNIDIYTERNIEV